MDINSTITLNDGVKIPVIGLGTWLSEPGEVKMATEVAIKEGFRHVDCAAIYKNEKVVNIDVYKSTFILCMFRSCLGGWGWHPCLWDRQGGYLRDREALEQQASS